MKKTLIIAKYTFVEVYKSRVLLNVVLLGFIQLLISFIASEFTFAAPDRIAIDFGLGVLTLSAVGIAIFMGVSLVSKEIETRTAQMVLSKPLRRYNFLLGRVLGLSCMLLLNILILGIFTTGFYLFLGGSLSPLIFWALFFAFIESVLVLALVVFFSLVTNNVMSVIYSLFLYVAGHAVGDRVFWEVVKHEPVWSKVIKIYSFIFPDFSKLNFKDHVIYQQTLPYEVLLKSLLYGSLYFGLLMFLSSLIFERKNLD